jgi:hypothetical protein
VAESDNLRPFIRDIAARHERIWREQAEMLRSQSRALDAITNELRDTRDERVAQTRALLKVLDRLDEGGAAA